MPPTPDQTLSRLLTPLRLLFWLGLAGLTALALVPAPYIPPLEILSLWDKAQHALGYGTLTLSALLAYPSANKLRLAALLLAHGVLIEVLQHLLGHRVGEWQDAAADALGVALALGVAALVGRVRAPKVGAQ